MSGGVGRRARRYALPGFMLACALPVAQADDEIAALRGQLQQIEALTRDFEARLRALETGRAASAEVPPGRMGATADVAAAPAVAAPARTAGAVPKLAWHQLHEGLSAEEVTALLGPPTRSFELSGRTVWYYRYPAAGAGSVFFTSAGRISSVQSP